MDCSTLTAFRQGLYACFTRARDALMNLADALLSDTSARSLVELTLAPCFGRRWPSLYAALQDGQIERAALRQLMAACVPAPGPEHRLVLGLDSSDIARPFAPTARDRIGLPLHNLPPGQHATTAGWRFSSLVLLPSTPSSWVYPLDTLRIPTTKTPAQVGAEQVRQIVPLLPDGPLLLGDRYYGSAAFLEPTAEVLCDKLLRLQGHRVFYRAAPPPSGRRGRPRLDGERFQCNDPATHGPADATWDGADEKDRRVQVSCWSNLHLRQCRQVSVSVLRVLRHAARDTKRDPRVSWFLWQSPTGHAPVLPNVCPTYRLRFGQEHGYRFAKQDLLWTQPRLRTPEQMQRWTDLVSAVQAQLVLARAHVAAERRPWERTRRPQTPQQVRRAMGRILCELGTPARVSQPRGYSPGRPMGASVTKAPRFQVVKKTKQTTTQII